MLRCVQGFSKAFSGMILERVFDSTVSRRPAMSSHVSITRTAIVVDPEPRRRPLHRGGAHEQVDDRLCDRDAHPRRLCFGRPRAGAANGRATAALRRSGGADWQYAFAEQSDGARCSRTATRSTSDRIHIAVRGTHRATRRSICAFSSRIATVSERPIGMCDRRFHFRRRRRASGSCSSEPPTSQGSMERWHARSFARSAPRTTLPDYLQLWPGHGAGSACGKALGAMPSTTLGYERIANWAFQIDDEERVRHGGAWPGSPSRPPISRE